MSQASTVQEEKKSILEASGEALCTMQDERQDAVCAAEDLCRAVETLRSQLQVSLPRLQSSIALGTNVVRVLSDRAVLQNDCVVPAFEWAKGTVVSLLERSLVSST